MKASPDNLDEHVVRGFGEEWERFSQGDLLTLDQRAILDGYFAVFPPSALSHTATGADFGCGSGRWAQLIAPRVRHLHLIDASDKAMAVARQNLAASSNVTFHVASIETANIAEGSLDFAYCLGVLHHLPDTEAALRAIVTKLKINAPFLVYLYYAFDNRPWWFRILWRLSDLCRRAISNTPKPLRFHLCDLIAATVYWPLARAARLLDRLKALPASWPLAAYRDRSFYVMRTDALDRFGTRLEKRYSRSEIEKLLVDAGLDCVAFSAREPFWCAVGRRRD